MVEFLIEPSGDTYKGWYVNISKICEGKTLLMCIVGDMAMNSDRGLYLYSIFTSNRVKILGVDMI